MAAVVAFGPRAGILAAAAMAALGPLSPEDVTERRWFQPAVNFGQMVLSSAAGAAVLALFLLPAGRNIAGTWTILPSRLWLAGLGSAVAAVVFNGVNYRLVRFIVDTVFGPRSVRPWSHMWQLHAGSLAMGFLGGLLGAAYLLVGTAALPLVFLVFFVGYLAFESYALLREAQDSTLKGFIKALEAKDLYTRGHTERVARFSEMIGRELGFNGTRLERLRWAALIHDVGKLAVPRELIRKRGRLTDAEYAVMQRHVHLVEDLLDEVDFLKPMVEIAADHHAHYDGNGYHGSSHTPGERPSLEACIVAVADSFDAMTSTRSYRVALTQEYALAELRRHAGAQFAPEVVAAFERALLRSGERYGSPRELTDEEARRLAEEGLDVMRQADQVHGRHFPVAPPGDSSEVLRG